MKTVMITGCSSGFGLAIARHFLRHNWKVIATMRVPREDVLPQSDHLRVMALDVTDPSSIRRALEMAGPIDILVNNAGIGAACPFELTSLEQSRALFETNTFGTIAMTQAVLPQFRERRAGVIINISSSVTLAALPLVSVYSASKAAVNALTRSMAVELAPFGIRTHLVLPGRSPETQFGANAHFAGMDHEAYADFAQHTLAGMREASGPVTYATNVAEAVWLAATDPSSQLEIPAGEDAIMMADAG
ncbi:SDR family oxidoreductase [Marinobacter nanhaiticus D15-8W]|uniref:SDR family oxidoreductase n=1 Tax=Marinobacter nanhaiticus D15-8W TaxID=626887 RepID=N6W6Z4_9GAMM|nr:SDR family oxidoreductase [Marinobacter nanhaiticus]ENO16024.2 SDR family oxidoreductase [Marinobacter nanhaiticus D15-8W]BES73116.1 SDR family oxidoreductase [Marinobacter nanhaiticus D15-8W]